MWFRYENDIEQFEILVVIDYVGMNIDTRAKKRKTVTERY